MSRLLSLFSSGLVITDGAWGTEFQKRGLAIGEPADVWNLTRPADVEAVARSYVEAGSHGHPDQHLPGQPGGAVGPWPGGPGRRDQPPGSGAVEAAVGCRRPCLCLVGADRKGDGDRRDRRAERDRCVQDPGRGAGRGRRRCAALRDLQRCRGGAPGRASGASRPGCPSSSRSRSTAAGTRTGP